MIIKELTIIVSQLHRIIVKYTQIIFQIIIIRLKNQFTKRNHFLISFKKKVNPKNMSKDPLQKKKKTLILIIKGIEKHH